MGKTILISSHILPELAEMCDSIGIIDQGRLVAQGSVAEIQQRLQGEKLIIVKLFHELDRAVTFFEDQPLISQLAKRDDEESLQFMFKGSVQEQVQLLKNALLHEIPIISFSEIETNLEDVFMEITKGVELS
jgi:ABC-2 type transport system ATP-binding protein